MLVVQYVVYFLRPFSFPYCWKIHCVLFLLLYLSLFFQDSCFLNIIEASASYGICNRLDEVPTVSAHTTTMTATLVIIGFFPLAIRSSDMISRDIVLFFKETRAAWPHRCSIGLRTRNGRSFVKIIFLLVVTRANVPKQAFAALRLPGAARLRVDCFADAFGVRAPRRPTTVSGTPVARGFGDGRRRDGRADCHRRKRRTEYEKLGSSFESSCAKHRRTRRTVRLTADQRITLPRQERN